ncbi:glycosyltransferase family 2 protein [Budviciaceae bacterium BWR-B9]|uniref:Glycosyltransferase family 2 protein n=1 Tax=Limnobaculum allomyrinae TaxID=2791986 RepID=A0ABS1ITH6_9GAMM|nr:MULTISPECIES: glycosyltransferase [Limnobaculum]MBK5145046.1 glycosyltransferase family 2 protein [Limnobaculum allomyrinae]MBV7692877.1 glycosyltransferase [Limnobaculum sp. M2-1]
MIYYICVNFNNSLYTEKFIESVCLQGPNTHALIVDNSSNLNELDKVERICNNYKQDKVTLIKNKENIGYFGGLNIAIRQIDKESPIIIGNNDLFFDDNFTKILNNKKYPDDVMIIAPNVITKDGYNQNPHCRKRVSTIRKFLYEIYFKSYSAAKILTFGSKIVNYIRGGRNNSFDQDSGYIHMGIGACYILLPSFFKYFEELDDKVFLYGEEAILAGQLMKVGGKMYYDHDLIVHHEESATLSKVPSKTKYNYMKDSYPKYKKYL